MNVFIDRLIVFLVEEKADQSLELWVKAVGNTVARMAGLRFLSAAKTGSESINAASESLAGVRWVVENADRIPGSEVFHLVAGALELKPDLDAGYRLRLKKHVQDTYKPPVRR